MTGTNDGGSLAGNESSDASSTTSVNFRRAPTELVGKWGAFEDFVVALIAPDVHGPSSALRLASRLRSVLVPSPGSHPGKPAPSSWSLQPYGREVAGLPLATPLPANVPARCGAGFLLMDASIPIPSGIAYDGRRGTVTSSAEEGAM